LGGEVNAYFDFYKITVNSDQGNFKGTKFNFESRTYF